MLPAKSLFGSVLRNVRIAAAPKKGTKKSHNIHTPTPRERYRAEETEIVQNLLFWKVHYFSSNKCMSPFRRYSKY